MYVFFVFRRILEQVSFCNLCEGKVFVRVKQLPDRQSDRDRRTGVRGACHNIDTCLVETLMLSEGHQRNVGFCLTFYIRHK